MNGAAILTAELDRARTVVTEAFTSLNESGAWPKPRHVALFALIDRINNPPTHDNSRHSESTPPPPVAADRLPFVTRSAPIMPSEIEEIGVPAVLIEHLSMLAKRPDGLLGGLTRERYPNLTEVLLDAIAESADPEQAALALRLVFGRIGHPAAYYAALSENERAIRRLVTVLASSSFVADTLASRPETLDIVMSAGGRVENPRRILARELRAIAAEKDSDRYQHLEAVVAALRRAKSRLFVEVVIADLGGAIELRTARQTLSDFADASHEQAARQVFDGDPRGLGIVALGKLGAQDLGYGSDLDVMFLYDPARAPFPSEAQAYYCLLYTSPSPRDGLLSRMPSSA